ncbi:MAG: tetratricopeptide repeat protein [Sandaracinaceae bacterium]
MPRTLPVLLIALVSVAGLSVACGGPAAGPDHAGTHAPPPEISEANVHEVLGAYWRMDPEGAERLAWRDALITHFARNADEVIERGDYDEVVRRLATLSELLTPEDIEAGRVPSAVVPLAQYLAEHGSPRGDEGRVMGALLLLAAVGEDAENARAERARIMAWGRDVRSGVSSPVESYGGLIQVWEQHEQIAPDPEVLEMLARLYAEQRDALLNFEPPEQMNPRSFHDLRLAPLLVQRAPLDVAAVYLRHGDLDRAIEHVGRMGDESGVERRLVSILRRAQENNAEGAESLDELARGFLTARPTISAAICRLGTRRFPRDARFARCLAAVALSRNRAPQATAWFADAVRLAPEDRTVYDEALGELGELVMRGLLQQVGPASRIMATQLLEILDARDARWPDAPSPLRRAAILLHAGRAEMGAGNVDAARDRLEASLRAEATPEAHQELGLLLERLGQPEEAAAHYRQALDLTPPEGIGQIARAQLMEDLGDAFRMAGNPSQSRRLYRQALAAWVELGAQLPEERRAVIDVRVGILQSRLGQASTASEAFVRAVEAAPTNREPYAEILAHLVVASPNVELAQRVLRRATYQLTLPREWRVYFALWVQAVAARDASEAESDVATLLGDLSEGDGWSSKLAAFGHADMNDEQLIAAATTPGERAEAYFYAGSRSLAAGDSAAARARFEQVIETRMVSFFEYAMAQELLGAME